jgi:CheY-like chemotaxis protein
VVKTLSTTDRDKSPHRCSYRIAVIEANRETAIVLRRAIQLQGHDFEAATDGPSGVELVKRTKPDVVLCCIELSGLDGFEVASAIRESLRRKPLLIAHTSYGKWEIGNRHRSRSAAKEWRGVVVDAVAALHLITS